MQLVDNDGATARGGGGGRGGAGGTSRSSTQSSEAEAKSRVEAAAHRSFLERIALPLEQRAAVFGMIFSADDKGAVRRLLALLRAVLFAWCDAATVQRKLRGLGRLVQFKHRVRLKETMWRAWMGRYRLQPNQNQPKSYYYYIILLYSVQLCLLLTHHPNPTHPNSQPTPQDNNDSTPLRSMDCTGTGPATLGIY